MIAQLKGELDSIEADHIILDVAGVGYKVYMPAKSMSQMPEIGSKVRLPIVTIVREDAITLYGFLKSVQKSMFELLLGVSGVGPKAALSILSELSVGEIHGAVVNDRYQVLSRVPGIGAKTAQRIAVDLKDKVAVVALEAVSEGVVSDEEKALMDAIDGLVSLGYDRYHARKASEQVLRDGAPAEVETIIPLALSLLSKG